MKASNKDGIDNLMIAASMAHMLSFSQQDLKAIADNINRISRHEEAKSRLMRVCADCKRLNLDELSVSEIEAMTEYIMNGFDTDSALKYAVSHGIGGLNLIKDLQRNFNLKLSK
ncbi:hypothetical protein ACU3L3_06995 [Priestia endophytica]